MIYLTCTTITSVDLAHYGVSRTKDWVSVDCGTILITAVLQLVAVSGLYQTTVNEISGVLIKKNRSSCA